MRDEQSGANLELPLYGDVSMIISKRDSIQGLCVSNSLQWLGCSVNTLINP